MIRKLFRGLAVTGCAVVILGASLQAQEVSHFSFAVGGGFTQTVGNTGRHLDDGWNIMAGGGFNFNRYVGAMVDLGYNRFDINGVTLLNAGFPDGDVSVFSATLDPIVHLNPGHRVDIYVTGGGGLYHVNQEFTQPSVVDAHGL